MNVQRHELKYLIHRIDYHALVNRIKYVLKTDPHSVPHEGYFIRSLYFDSSDDECYNQKLAGIKNRQKYRMRIYDVDSKEVKFEIKNKDKDIIFKETATISKETALKVINGNYKDLLTYGNSVLNKIFTVFSQKRYTPRVIIDYHRDAFVYDLFNTRITIDKKVMSSHFDLNLFSKELHMLPVIFEQKEILEIKFDSYLPDFIRRLIQLDSFERQAISKYALSRRHYMLTT